MNVGKYLMHDHLHMNYDWAYIKAAYTFDRGFEAMKILNLSHLQFLLFICLFGNSINAEEYYGANLGLGYVRGDEHFLIDKTLRAYRRDESTPELFNVTENPTTIMTMDGIYIGVSEASGSLIHLNSGDEGQVFKFLPSLNQSYFIINYGDEPLVTPNSLPPFNFYLQRYYEDEPAAIFYLAALQPTVMDIYDGNRSNTEKTIQFIRTTDYIDLTQGYTDLLNIMNDLGHSTLGSEVFDVGYFITKDLGTSSAAFNLLPQAAQYLLLGLMVNLNVEILGIGTLMLSDAVVSDLDSRRYTPFPYSFTFDESTRCWNIVYLKEYPCTLTYSSDYIRCTSNADNEGIFRLALVSATTFIISILKSFESYYTQAYGTQDHEFVFVLTTDYISAKFTPEPYEVNLVNLYENTRDKIPNATLAISKFSDQKLTQYKDLYGRMDFNNHIPGAEIFSLARYVFEDLGPDSEVFRALPKIVQTVVSEKNLTWTYCKSENTCDDDAFRMKYSFASNNHLNVQPFQLQFSNYSLVPVAITYADTHNLVMNGNMLDHVASQDSPSELFRLHLTASKTLIAIEVQATTEFLITDDSSPEFYFRAFGSISGSAPFKFDEF